MNIYSLMGLGLAIFVLLFGLKLASEDISIFLDYPSLFIVIGGTLASTAISFQLNRIIILVKVFFRRVVKGKRLNYANVITEIMKISEAYRKGESLENHITKVKDPFLREALELINEGVLEDDHLIRVLRDRAGNMSENYSEEARKMKAVAKFPPAFGMMGTTIGMIVLLANLGGEDAIKKIGPAMAVCLITTLYGVIIANLIVLPIAENLTDGTREIHLKNQIIIEGIRLLLRKVNPIVVAIELNSYLSPGDRLDWKQVIGR